jgi:hypothetical protein
MITSKRMVGQGPRLAAKTRVLWEAIQAEFRRQEPPMTVRQMFYRMSATSQVEKTEGGYRQVQRALAEMRRDGVVPYEWIADNSRQVHVVQTWDSVGSILEAAADGYRRDPWEMLDEQVQIWLEKDALAGVIKPVTFKYRVPLYVTRGYSSLSYLHDAAEEMRDAEKPIVIYHLGDYDASGRDAARAIRESLRDDFDLADIEFHELAVTTEQIEEWGLQTRPAKQSDPRSKGWGEIAVELDAIPPNRLRDLIDQAIQGHIDPQRWEASLQREVEERDRLQELVDQAQRLGRSQ